MGGSAPSTPAKKQSEGSCVDNASDGHSGAVPGLSSCRPYYFALKGSCLRPLLSVATLRNPCGLSPLTSAFG